MRALLVGGTIVVVSGGSRGERGRGGRRRGRGGEGSGGQRGGEEESAHGEEKEKRGPWQVGTVPGEGARGRRLGRRALRAAEVGGAGGCAGGVAGEAGASVAPREHKKQVAWEEERTEDRPRASRKGRKGAGARKKKRR